MDMIRYFEFFLLWLFHAIALVALGYVLNYVAIDLLLPRVGGGPLIFGIIALVVAGMIAQDIQKKLDIRFPERRGKRK